MYILEIPVTLKLSGVFVTVCVNTLHVSINICSEEIRWSSVYVSIPLFDSARIKELN